MGSDAESRRPARGRLRPRKPEHTLDELRELLVQPEKSRLQSIEHRLDASPSADAVADVLSDAAVKARAGGPGLTWAFAPVVVEAFRDATAKEPALVTDVVAPIIGPAIRKAIARAMDALMDRVNATLGQTFSLRSLKWRLEAQRTGRPFGEIVLSHTLVYRVEQIFLIRRDSALVLQHLVAENVRELDPDQVAAMLTAIESFVHEAFAEHERLDHFTLGDVTCLVENGPRALLVAVVRGIAPASYRTLLAQTLERIHLEYARELECVQCDPAPFVRTQPALRALLHDEQQRATGGNRAATIAIALACVALLTAIAIPAGLRHSAAIAERARYETGLRALRAEPGLVVTASGHRHGTAHYEGLRDPLARAPGETLRSAALPRARYTVSFAPFYSLDPRLLERRARVALSPPASVSLSTDGTVVRARGAAPRAWIDEARVRAGMLPGVTAFDDTGVRDVDAIARARQLSRDIDDTVVPFATASDDPSRIAPALMDSVAAKLRALRDVADRAGLEPHVAVAAHADPRGRATDNRSLGEARRANVIAALEQRGVPDEMLRVAPATVLQVPVCEGKEGAAVTARHACDAGRAQARRAGFQVSLESKPYGPQRSAR
jgi:OOP family OmpA-OmpF porin